MRGFYRFRAIIFSISVLAGLIFLGLYKENKTDDRIGYIYVKPGESKLYIDDADLCINGWDSYGVTYFFIPAYAQISEISYERSPLAVYSLDGSLLEKPVFNTVQEVLVETEGEDEVLYNIGFFQAKNLYTLNINTKGEGIESVSREHYLPVSVNMISLSGEVVYSDDYTLIKGRGNFNWDYSVKKSYELVFPKEVSLLSMKKSKQWAVLGNSGDSTGIINKMTFDTSAKMGMEYSIESDWVDVYVDDEYRGCYLLCHEPDIGKDDFDIRNLEKENREFYDAEKKYDDGESRGYIFDINPEDISGGYLIEVDNYSERRSCGFYLPNKVFFNIKSPNNASREQVKYIQSFVKGIDSEIAMSSSTEMIDFYSFACRYLIDESLFNMDAYTGSYYFYKKADRDILYAGPCWDYDGLNYDDTEGSIFNNDTILDYDRKMLEWDKILIANNNEYRDCIRKTLIKNAGIWDDLLLTEIDEYYERVRDSMCMDYYRWGQLEEVVMDMERPTPEDSIKQFKQSLYTRLSGLAIKWNVDYSFTCPRERTD